jgi:hypothetical protein
MADDALAEHAALIHDAVRLLAPRSSTRVVVDIALADGRVASVRLASSEPSEGPKADICDPAFRVGQLANALEWMRVHLRREGIAWTPGSLELALLTKGTATKGTALRFFGASDRPAHTIELAIDDRFALVNERLFAEVDDATRTLAAREGDLPRLLRGAKGARIESDGSAVRFELADGSKRAFPLRVVAARASDSGVFTWSWASRSLPPSATTDVRDACRAISRLDLRAFERPSFRCETAFAEGLARVVVARMGADATYRVPATPTTTLTIALSAR